MSPMRATASTHTPTAPPPRLRVQVRAGAEPSPHEAEATRAARDWSAGVPRATATNVAPARGRAATTHPAAPGGGRALEPVLRKRMEHFFGCDFGQVRVHADRAAERSASLVNARAYALGEQLVFNRGQYQPSAASGQQLLAHELAHVVQQRAAGTPQLARESYSEDESSCTLTGSFDAGFAFLATSRAGWTPDREQAFMRAATQAIETTFNANSYRIRPARATVPGRLWGENPCPCSASGFTPRVAMTADHGSTTSFGWGLDWRAAVFANPSGTFRRSSSSEGSEDLGNLDEADVQSSDGQTAIVHEFGHSIGLHHPGRGVAGIAANEGDEYRHTGADEHGRAVAAADLMGEGMGLRPFCFERWVRHLEDEHPGCGYAIAEPAPAAATPTETTGRPTP